MESLADNHKTALVHFDFVLDEALDHLQLAAEPDADLEPLVAGAGRIGEAAIEVGNAASERLEAGGSAGVQDYVIPFLWAGRVKAFLILWRDVVFEIQRALTLLHGGRLSGERYAELRRQSVEVLRSAAEELKAYPEREIQSIRRGRGGAGQRIKQWRLMANPWATYREQIAFLPAQCKCLLDEHRELKKAGNGFAAVRALIGKTIDACEKEVDEMGSRSNQTIAFIEEQIEAAGGPKPGKIATRLEDLEGELELPNYLAVFNGELEEQMAGLPEKTQVSVQIDEGMVQYREINFRRGARQWLESEILPVLYEIWEVTAEVRQSLRMSLVNIRNRALLLATEMREGRTPDVERADLCQPLLAFLKKLDDYKERLGSLHGLIGERLAREFHLPAAYELTREFLPVPLQSTINQLGFSRNAALNWGRRGFLELTGRLQQFKAKVEREEALGASEKIVRFIRGRAFPVDNQHYTSIFITRGYIGESFWVGRRQELEHMAALIDHWRQGFRGAVILSGRRFSGKSLFGEIVANRHFPKSVIHLAPKSLIRVQGRQMTAGYDLGEALDFIRKHSLNIRPLVWIDDLELWQDPEHSLSANVRMLRKTIDANAGRIFFMVSMSNWLRAHLRRFHEIDKSFQAEINLDRMPADDIRDAILIRHGATHKTLVDEMGREATPQQFRKMTNRIAKVSEGNIGEALNLWAGATQMVNEEQVRHDLSNRYPLPDFLNPDVAMVLSAILLRKRTNEYRLRKQFGPAFADKYGGIVQRLISLGLLTRLPDGWLELNELVVNPVGKMLEKKQYLPI